MNNNARMAEFMATAKRESKHIQLVVISDGIQAVVGSKIPDDMTYDEKVLIVNYLIEEWGLDKHESHH